MAKSMREMCADALAGGELASEEDVARVTGLPVASVRRVRMSDGFDAEVVRRAKARFVGRLPAVLKVLGDGAAQGGNASVMKLFLDACRVFEGSGCGAGGDDAAREGLREVEELLERVREAGA